MFLLIVGMPTLLLCWQSVDTAAANQSAFLQGWKREKENQVWFILCAHEMNQRWVCWSSTNCWIFFCRWNGMQNTISWPVETCAKPRYLPTIMPSILKLKEKGRCTPHKTTHTNTESAQGNTETTTAINTRTRVVVNVTGSLASDWQPLDQRTGKGGGNAWKSNATRARPFSPATGCTLD